MQRPKHFSLAGIRRFILLRSKAGQLALYLLMMSLIAGCGQSQEEGDPSNGQSDAPQQDAIEMQGLSVIDDLGPPHLLAFTCKDEAPYLAIHDPAEEIVMLYTSDQVHRLTHQPAASGAKYSDQRHTFWTKGHDMISLEIDGVPVEGCRPSGRQRILTAAYQAGYHLRASGNEPGWTLLVGPQSIRLDLQDRPGAIFTGLKSDESVDDGLIVRQTDQHSLKIVIEDRTCRDTMSGEPAPLSVAVELDGDVLHGCGVPLARIIGEEP
jgi:uncharacterized membrane protein